MENILKLLTEEFDRLWAQFNRNRSRVIKIGTGYYGIEPAKEQHPHLLVAIGRSIVECTRQAGKDPSPTLLYQLKKLLKSTGRGDFKIASIESGERVGDGPVLPEEALRWEEFRNLAADLGVTNVAPRLVPYFIEFGPAVIGPDGLMTITTKVYRG
jgi:hypothetical protein